MDNIKRVLHAVPRILLLVLLACSLMLTGCGTEPPKYSELRERYVPYVDNLLIIHSGESPTEEFQQARRLVLAAEELEGYRQFERIKNTTEDPLERAHCYNGMGVAMISMSKFRDARALLNRAEELYTQAEGENSVGVGIAGYNLAAMFDNQDPKNEAGGRIQKAEEIINASYPDASHPDRLALTLLKLNRLIRGIESASNSDADSSINQYMAQVKTGLNLAFGPEDMLVRMGENAYAMFLRYEKGNGYLEVKLPRAKKIYEESREIFSNALGPEHPQVGAMDYELAYIHTRINGFDATAIELYESAKEIYNKHYGPNNIINSWSNYLLGLSYEETDLEKAKAALEEARDISWRTFEAGKISAQYVMNFLLAATMKTSIDKDDPGVKEIIKANYIYINYIHDAEIRANTKKTTENLFNKYKLGGSEDFETWFAEQLAIVGPEFEAEYEASEKELEAARIYKGD